MTNQTVSDLVGANIRALREQNKWTRDDLAARCARLGRGAEKLTAAAITNIELGKRDADGRRRRDITVDEVVALSQAFGVPAAALVPQLGEDLLDQYVMFGVDDMIERLVQLKEFTARIEAKAAKGIFGPPPAHLLARAKAATPFEIERLNKAASAAAGFLDDDQADEPPTPPPST